MRPHRLLLILLSSLLWTAHAEAQTIDLPAMIRCKAEGERAPSRSQLIETWLSRAEKRDAIAAFCLAYVQSDKVHVPLGWLEQSARLNLPDAQLLMGTNYEVGFLFNQQSTDLDLGGTSSLKIADVSVRNYQGGGKLTTYR